MIEEFLLNMAKEIYNNSIYNFGEVRNFTIVDATKDYIEIAVEDSDSYFIYKTFYKINTKNEIRYHYCIIIAKE